MAAVVPSRRCVRCVVGRRLEGTGNRGGPPTSSSPIINFLDGSRNFFPGVSLGLFPVPSTLRLWDFVLISKGGADSKSYMIYSITNFDNPCVGAFSSNAVSVNFFKVGSAHIFC